MNEKYIYLLHSFCLIKMCCVDYILISIPWNLFTSCILIEVLHELPWWSYLVAQRVETYLNHLFFNNIEKRLSTSWWNAIFLGFLFQYRQFSFAPNAVLISPRSFGPNNSCKFCLSFFFAQKWQQKLCGLAASTLNEDDENIFILNGPEYYSLIKLFVKFPSFQEPFFSFSDSIFACSVYRCGKCLWILKQLLFEFLHQTLKIGAKIQNIKFSNRLPNYLSGWKTRS